MSTLSPLIADWNSHRLEWIYDFQPTVRPFTLAPGERRLVPTQDYIFKAPEGILIQMSAVFDSPYGGFSMMAEPNMDIGVVNTVINNLVAGATTPNGSTHARVPPATPPGVYSIHCSKEQPWLETCRLYVLNSDPSNSITCIGYGYTMAYLKKPRRDESIVPLKEIAEAQHAASLYPETREALRRRLRGRLDQYLERMGVKTP